MHQLSLLLVACLILLPMDGKASDRYQPHRMSVTFVEGLGLPVGDYGDIIDWSMGLGLELDYLLLPSLKIGVSGVYRWTSITEEGRYVAGQLVEDALGTGIALQPQIRSYDVMASFKWLIPSSGTPTPYVRGQLGYFGQELSAEATNVISGESVQESDSETAFGYGIGLGAEFWGSGRIGAQLEILYISGLTDPNADFFEIRAGLKIGLGSKN